MCNRAQQRATAVSSGTTRPAKPGIIRSSSHRRRIAPCALSRRSMPRMPCSSFRMVIADKKVSAGATLPAQAATFGSALPVAAFRNSDTTFVSSRYIPSGQIGGPRDKTRYPLPPSCRSSRSGSGRRRSDQRRSRICSQIDQSLPRDLGAGSMKRKKICEIYRIRGPNT